MPVRFRRAVLILACVLASGCSLFAPRLSSDEIPGAIKDLGGTSRKDRLIAMHSLARTGSPAVPALLAMIREGDENRRYQAVRTLGLMGSGAGEAAPALAVLLADESLTFPSSVAGALGEIGPASLAPVREALRSPSESARYWSVSVAEKFAGGDEAVIADLVQVTGDSSAAVVARAETALLRLGSPAVPALARGLASGNREVQSSCTWILGRSDDERARAALAALEDQGGAAGAEPVETSAAVSATPAASAAPGPLRLAVADLAPRSVAASDAAIAGDWLRSDLVSSKAFVVLERQQMERVLAEQSPRRTGCTSEDCAVQLGRLLSVQRIVVGSFGKVQGAFVLDVRVVSVESGAVVYTGQARGENDRKLGKGIRELALRMAREVR